MSMQTIMTMHSRRNAKRAALGRRLALIALVCLLPAVCESVTYLAPGIGAMRGALSAPTSQVSGHFARLNAIVHPIETVTRRADGATVREVGSGFVVGRRFFTAEHNLRDGSLQATGAIAASFVAGRAVSAALAYPQFDWAVIDLPDELCANLCNNDRLTLSDNPRPTPQGGLQVVWLRKVRGELILKRARLIDYAVLNARAETHRAPSATCSDNLVGRIDAPFIRGSSGGPVLDAKSGTILGIIQGTMGRGPSSLGYFKPIECILAML